MSVMPQTVLAVSVSIPPETVFNIGPLQVTDTMVSAFVTMLALVLFALVVRIFFIPRWRKDDEHVSGFRLFIEAMVNIFDSSAREQNGLSISRLPDLSRSARLWNLRACARPRAT